MTQTIAAKEKQAKLSFFAGALFFLAGALNMFVSLRTHSGTSLSSGAVLIAVGVLWIAIGAGNRREAGALQASGSQQGEQ